MSKNIWIINEYAGSPYHGMEYRHYYLGKELNKLDNKVTIISSSYSHLFKTLPKKKKENIDGIDYLWIKTFNYGLAHDKRRVLKWLLFMFKIFFLPFSLKKPDVIIVSPMAVFCIFPAWVLAKIYKAKLVFEVKDIWPLSLISLGGFKESHPFIKLMGYFEKFAVNKSDLIVSNLQNYGEHIKNDLNINKEFEWISNGVDLEELKEIEDLDKNIKELIPKDKFIFVYTGTIGLANAMDCFLQAAKDLENEKEIFFLIVGNGQSKKRLMSEYKSDNILFIDEIPKKQIQSILSLCDVCFLSWNKEFLYKYGTSANKLFDYMYSSKPIINAFSGGGDLVKYVNCGFSPEAQNSEEIKKTVLKLYNMSEKERNELGSNGKKYVLEYFTYEKLAKKYDKLLQRD